MTNLKTKLGIGLLLFLFATNSWAQNIRPTIMVIPFTKEGEDIRRVLDDDINRRIGIARVKQGFDNSGYRTVDFLGKLRAVLDNKVFNIESQTDLKAEIIHLSGSDIYVVVEVNTQSSNSEASVNVILSAYETSTGNSLANTVGSSGKFFTSDIGKLTSKAVENCIDDFVKTIDNKLSSTIKKGHSLIVDFTFAQGSSFTMKSSIDKHNGRRLSDLIEDWMHINSVEGDYHIQGITDLRMIFDNVTIPVGDPEGNPYTSNRYGTNICEFLFSLGITANKDIKGNTVYITIN